MVLIENIHDDNNNYNEEPNNYLYDHQLAVGAVNSTIALVLSRYESFFPVTGYQSE